MISVQPGRELVEFVAVENHRAASTSTTNKHHQPQDSERHSIHRPKASPKHAARQVRDQRSP